MTDVALAPVIQQVIDEAPKDIPAHLTPQEKREYLHLLGELTFLRYGLPGPEVHSVSDVQVPVQGGEILARVYWPTAASRLPCHVTLHGGGWTAGSVTGRIGDAMCRQRCREAGCVLIAVDYRLAPEYRFPIPLDDCCAVLSWAVANAGLLDIDPSNMSIGGASAGANLAAAVALRCRDEHGPRLVFQLLEAPVLDLTGRTARETLKSGLIPDVIPQSTIEDLALAYLGDPARAQDPLASPLLANDLRGLPPAHIMTAEYDILHTEGELYADRLALAGVPVTRHRYPEALHGTLMYTRIWELARTWQHDAASALKRAHRPAPSR